MNNLMSCRILKSVEEDLRNVVKSLVSAEPEKLESAQRLLEHMVSTLGEVEASARRDASLPIKEVLHGIKLTLGQAGALSTNALVTVERRANLAGLAVSEPGGLLHLEA